MYSWIVGRIVRLLIGQLNAGRVRLLIHAFAPDALFVFPGSSSFGGELRGKAAIATWLERFVALRPTFVVHDVAVAGPPWSMRVCFRFSDRIPAPGGGAYRNEGMEYLRIRWGLIREQRVYLDTERVAALDVQLAAAGEPAARAARSPVG